MSKRMAAKTQLINYCMEHGLPQPKYYKQEYIAEGMYYVKLRVGDHKTSAVKETPLEAELQAAQSMLQWLEYLQ
jgi:hypothetical protein